MVNLKSFVNYAFDTDKTDVMTRVLDTNNDHKEEKCEDSKNINGKLVLEMENRTEDFTFAGKHSGVPQRLLGTSKRKMSDISMKVMMQKRRDQGLTDIRGTIKNSLLGGNILFQSDVQALLEDTEFSRVFFVLFDSRGSGYLEQSSWFGQLRYWAKDQNKSQNKLNLVELLEAVTYLISGDNKVNPDTFHEVISSRGVAHKLVQVLEEEILGTNVKVDDFMSLIMKSTLEPNLNAESTEQLRKVFQQHFGKDKQEISLQEFKLLIPSKGKDDFFIRRIFSIFDQDGNGSVSLAEFLETVDKFSSKDDDTKIEFLFRIYDVSGDGVINEKEFQQVITACMKENGMDFDDDELTCLAHGLFVDGVEEGRDTMTLDEFHKQLQRQEGLVGGLGIMINKWLVPPKQEKEKSFLEKLCLMLPHRHISKDYWQNNKVFLFFVLFVVILNLVLFIHRAHYFRNFAMLNGLTPNPFYLISRACGRVLLFNSVLVLMLVLRNSITLLRKLGLAAYLPLDHNIYLHKMVGILIFLQATLHSLMHLCNFAINIQPDPVKFLQLTYKYWEDNYGVDIPLTLYKVPEGCTIVESSSLDSQNCLPGSLDVPSGVNPDFIYNNGEFLCQACNGTGTPWTYADWIFTTRPHMFGLMPGIASPTGVALICILTVMFVCSLPFIRRRGYFSLFYLTHLLYHAYFVLLLLHAPEFWKWFAVIGVIWAFESIYRVLHSFFGHGKSVIRAGVVLPSKVTNLIIERPPGFNFSAGDWVRVRIPAVASSEWHPFTISSAPEMPGHFTLHIRGVGQWTNSLYTLFETEYARQQAGISRKRSKLERLESTVTRRLKSIETNKIKKEIFADTYNDKSKLAMEKIQDESAQFKQQKAPCSRSSARIVKYDFDAEKEVVNAPALKIVIGGNQLDIEEKAFLETPLDIYIDGPFGSPSSNIYRAEHAVLIGTGIGVTPFASILQSIMHRYRQSKQCCPNCNHKWTSAIKDSMFKLKKVDFFWINRDQKSFEWFVNLLSELEIEQSEHGGAMGRFLDMHMYITSALQRTDMKAVALQLALDILHQKEKRDLLTGLKARTNAGRPNWNKVFTQLRQEKKGKVTIFYCGNPMLARTLRSKCEEFGFEFRKECF